MTLEEANLWCSKSQTMIGRTYTIDNITFTVKESLVRKNCDDISIIDDYDNWIIGKYDGGYVHHLVSEFYR